MYALFKKIKKPVMPYIIALRAFYSLKTVKLEILPIFARILIDIITSFLYNIIRKFKLQEGINMNKDFVLKHLDYIIESDNDFYDCMPKKLRTDPDVLEKIIATNDNYLAEIDFSEEGKKLLGNREFILKYFEILSRNTEVWEYLPKKLKTDPTVIDKAISCGVEPYIDFSEEGKSLLKNEKFVLDHFEIMQECNDIYEFLPDKLKYKEEIIKKAIAVGAELDYSDSRIKPYLNEKIVKQAIKNDHYVDYKDQQLRSYYDEENLVKEALKNSDYKTVIKIMGDKLEDEETLLKLIAFKPAFYVSLVKREPKFIKPVFINATLKERPDAYNWFPDNMKTAEMRDYAMEHGVLPKEYNDNTMVVYKMLSQGHLIISSVSPRLQQNKNVIEMALKINRHIGSALCKEARNNPEIMTLMVKREASNIRYLGDQLASDQTFIHKLTILNPNCKKHLQ